MNERLLLALPHRQFVFLNAGYIIDNNDG